MNILFLVLGLKKEKLVTQKSASITAGCRTLLASPVLQGQFKLSPILHFKQKEKQK